MRDARQLQVSQQQVEHQHNWLWQSERSKNGNPLHLLSCGVAYDAQHEVEGCCAVAASRSNAGWGHLTANAPAS